MKKYDYVYCAPDMRHGTIDQTRGDRFYVEWDEPDENEDTGAWYYEDELEKPRRKKPSKSMRKSTRKITPRTLKYMGVKINNAPDTLVMSTIRLKGVVAATQKIFSDWKESEGYNDKSRTDFLEEYDEGFFVYFNDAQKALDNYKQKLLILVERIRDVAEVSEKKYVNTTYYGRD